MITIGMKDGLFVSTTTPGATIYTISSSEPSANLQRTYNDDVNMKGGAQ